MGSACDLKQAPTLLLLPSSLRVTSVSEENISPWFLGCLLVLSIVIHACEMLGDAVSLSFFKA